MIEKGGRTVNEIYKELAVFLEELRCDTYEKKYAVKTEDLKKADSQLKEKNRKFEAFLNDISEKDKEFIESYLNAVNIAHFKGAKSLLLGNHGWGSDVGRTGFTQTVDKAAL